MPSVFTFRATQPPVIGAMAKITLLHRVAYEKAAPSSGLTSLGMKIRNRHIETSVYKNVQELQSSWKTNRKRRTCPTENLFALPNGVTPEVIEGHQCPRAGRSEDLFVVVWKELVFWHNEKNSFRSQQSLEAEV
ncbi:hypothetical protein AVEN_263073-1 [Araneus ventricosus]|uniref:Uncharacterized protein n=1 Tax=Araneus ventricosus TaxID=182803 RepID=A0A4Y2U6I8_ARAVE|nr:hypothetical protein AVEN_263073-1 [Araneus ventricosus]